MYSLNSDFFCVKFVFSFQTDVLLFKLFGFEKNWNDAHTHCKNYGATLATVITPEDNEFLIDMIQVAR